MTPRWPTTPDARRDPVEDAFAGVLEVVQNLARAVRAKHSAERVDTWLSLADAARYAGVSQVTVRRWIASGNLRYGRAGRAIRVKASDIDAFYLGHAGAYQTARSEEDEMVQREVQRIPDSL